jgi:hypothetical protein
MALVRRIIVDNTYRSLAAIENTEEIWTLQLK